MSIVPSPLHLAALGLAGLLPLAFHALIRWGLRAPRVRECGNPARLGLPWREVRIETARRKRLGAWLIPARPGAPALVVLHGWGGNAEMMLPLAPPLHRAGYTLLLIDARNHGMSDGDTFSSLPRFAEDLEHALDWLKREPGAEPAWMGVVGHSVGAGAALLVASRRADLAGVVSLAAFAHPEEMMQRWLAAKRLPAPLRRYIIGYVQRVIGWRLDEIAPCRTIARVACPVLIVHGDEDETVPLEDACRIYANRAHERVERLVLPGSHDEFPPHDGPFDTLLSFLARLGVDADGRAR